ncbi:glycosyltransferase [Clostridium sp. CF012]|uniref:glycosyltransferase n=1 Tax=Clostridium sp. CF012 TaxID=2843319 RepID=UPI001C0B25EE|nr:glycosyltransferase [Clostridium sp. CF012]MBU3142618.1 glycosyltransferase [Clostridium sp. CF012]
MEKMPEIVVSLIMPVYNVEAYIEKCLCSALSQTLTDIEIIVVNDGSTDNSMKIVNSFASKYNNLRIINKENGGLSSARNSGLEIARGKYIAFIDSDDYIDKAMIEEMYASARDRQLDIVCCNLTKVDSEGTILGQEKNIVDYDRIYNKDEVIRAYLTNNIPAYAWNKLYSKSLFVQGNITYPEGMLYEDIGTTFELFFKADRVGFIDEPLYSYVQREGAITKVPSFKAGRDIISTVNNIKSSLNESELYYKYEEVFQSFSLKYLFLANVLFYKRYGQAKKLEKVNNYKEHDNYKDYNSYKELEGFRELVSIKIAEINSKSIMHSKYLSTADKLKYLLLKTGLLYFAVSIRETLLKVKNKLCLEG